MTKTYYSIIKNDIFGSRPLWLWDFRLGGGLRVGNDRTRNFLPNPNRTEPPIFFAEPNRTETEPNFCAYDLRSYQLKLIKMRAELSNLNHCAIPFLSRAAINLSVYNSSPVMK